MRVSLHDFPHATKSAASRFFALLIFFTFLMMPSSIFNSFASSANILHTYFSNHLIRYVFCIFFSKKIKMKIIIFSSISCFYYLYRRLMFLLSFLLVLFSRRRIECLFANRWCAFVCVCLCTCLSVCVTLLLVINQAIQFDFSANNGISKQQHRREVYCTTQLLQLSKRVVFSSKRKEVAFVIQTGRRF